MVEPTRRECLSSVCKLELTSHKVVAYCTGEHLPDKVHVPFWSKKAVCGITVEVLSERLQLKLADLERSFDELYQQKIALDHAGATGSSEGDGGGDLGRWPSSGSEGGAGGGDTNQGWDRGRGGGGQYGHGGGGGGGAMKSGWMNRAIQLCCGIVNNDFDAALADVIKICARFPKVYSEVWKSLGSIHGIRGPLFGCGWRAGGARGLGSHGRLVCCRAEVA